MHIPHLRALGSAALLIGLTVSGPAMATTTTTDAHSTTMAPTASTVTPIASRCPRAWRAKRDNAPVYELPRSDQQPLKFKSKGNIVRDWCLRHRNKGEKNRLYIAVITKSAADTIGWMRREDLTRPSY